MKFALSNLAGMEKQGESFLVGTPEDMQWMKKEIKRLHLFALGDVGATLLLGLRLMGGDCLEEIGIYDIRDHVGDRYEFEMNQILDPTGKCRMPRVRNITEEELFDCDVFLFCASLRVPPVSETKGDVRMAQFEANAGLMKQIAGKAAAAGYEGLFCVVSDPVDPLCKQAALAGLAPCRIKGFGLGVMNARAVYYAEQDPRLAHYLPEGRAYGPHGEDLVIADSLEHFNPELSRELTEKTVTANLRMREMGFKPYIAPAMSSGAFSILASIRGDWHYSSIWMDGVYFGARNRCTVEGIEVENPWLAEELYQRCKKAYDHLADIL